MTKQQALDQLRIMQAWHEDNGNGPCPDYDAICYAINIIEAQPKELDTLIKALEIEHKKLREMQKEMQKEQKHDSVSCIYCHEDSDGYVKPIEKNGHAFVRFGMNGWVLELKAKGWHEETKIQYCPMCGRKL